LEIKILETELKRKSIVIKKITIAIIKIVVRVKPVFL
jgi:hypothetical protein